MSLCIPLIAWPVDFFADGADNAMNEVAQASALIESGRGCADLPLLLLRELDGLSIGG
jgi:hypothetical protein